MTEGPLTVQGLPAKVRHLLGKRGFAILLLTGGVSFIQAGTELVLALFLQVFLVAVGVAERSMLPDNLTWAADVGALQASGALVVLGIFRSLGTFLGAQVAALSGETIMGRVRSLAIHELLFPSQQSNSPNSDAQYRFGELAARTNAWANSLVGILIYSMQAGVLLSMMLVTAWRESLLSLASLSVVGLLFRVLHRQVKTAATRLPEFQRGMVASMERVIRNRIYVTLMHMEPQEEDRLLTNLTNMQRLSLRNFAAANALNAFTPSFGILVVAGVVYAGQVWFDTSGLKLLSFLYLMFRFVQSAQTALTTYLQSQMHLPFLRNSVDFGAQFTDVQINDANRYNAVLPLLGTQRTSEPSVAATGSMRAGAPVPPRIDLQSVSFAYGNGAPVLERFDLKVEPGEQLAIVGPSGVGKSTVLLLLLGALKPTGGKVLVDELAAEQWRKDRKPRVGYVGPDPFLVMGNLRDNLCYGLGTAIPEERLMNALRFAHLEDFATPEKIRRTVSEDLQGLSAGQKQRLCLARAWLCEPDLLILDEATANVDEATETLIADSIKTLKGVCTTVLVTHRRGLMLHADRVVDLGTGAGRNEDPAALRA